jgi:hypothetical protein
MLEHYLLFRMDLFTSFSAGEVAEDSISYKLI